MILFPIQNIKTPVYRAYPSDYTSIAVICTAVREQFFVCKLYHKTAYKSTASLKIINNELSIGSQIRVDFLFEVWYYKNRTILNGAEYEPTADGCRYTAPIR
jgi:hypothetical protein